MSTQERGIVFTNDLDGVHFKAPIPLKTTLRLLRRDNSLPEVGSPVGDYALSEGWREMLFSRWSIFFHQISPINKDALEGLAIFRQAAEEHQRQLAIAALSGRKVDKHAITRQRLLQTGHMEYFTELHLNQGRSSSGWKESVVRGLTEGGLNVVHIDDDLRAGLCIARVNDEYPDEERVLVYMMRNLSNNPRLLRRAGIETPDNLVFVHSFREAATDFAERLTEGKL